MFHLDPGLAALGALIALTAGNLVAGLVASRKRIMLPPMVPPTTEPARVDLNAAIETVLVKSMQTQADMVERMNRLNVENAQLAIDRLQHRKKTKAGMKRSLGAGRNLDGTYKRDCRLCLDPFISDPTVAEIVEHSVHRQRRPRQPKDASPAVAYEDKGTHIEAHLDERAIQVGADGVSQIECPDCPITVPHTHGPGN